MTDNLSPQIKEIQRLINKWFWYIEVAKRQKFQEEFEQALTVEDEGNKPQWSMNPYMADNQIAAKVFTVYLHDEEWAEAREQSSSDFIVWLANQKLQQED